MKLNPDCIRDILMTVEDVTTSSMTFFMQTDKNNFLTQYTNDEVVYHFRQCNYNGFFIKYTEDIYENIEIVDLSPTGHQFIANIREKTIWKGIKNIAEKVGSISLDALIQISSNVVTEIIKKQFNLS